MHGSNSHRRRRQTHIGVLSDGMWVAHDRRSLEDNEVLVDGFPTRTGTARREA